MANAAAVRHRDNITGQTYLEGGKPVTVLTVEWNDSGPWDGHCSGLAFA